jgi:AraC-like DNA-binding protein
MRARRASWELRRSGQDSKMTAPIPPGYRADPAALGPGDRARLWREPRHQGLECLSASFRTHRYPLHAHDTYVVGVIVAGCETYRLRGVRRYAGPGDICLVNPGEAHDGEPYEDGYAYRMTYPSVELMRAICEDATGRGGPETPCFRPPTVRDGDAAGLFRTAHERLERGGDGLAADECLVAAYGLMLLHHADGGAPARLGRERSPVARAPAYIDTHFSGEIGLAALARIAGLSPFHLLRAFRRETGLTPHAYLMSRRVNAAREKLSRGSPPADVAAACGFFDQSHLTRVFKAHTGVTPGAFRAG